MSASAILIRDGGACPALPPAAPWKARPRDVHSVDDHVRMVVPKRRETILDAACA